VGLAINDGEHKFEYVYAGLIRHTIHAPASRSQTSWPSGSSSPAPERTPAIVRSRWEGRPSDQSRSRVHGKRTSQRRLSAGMLAHPSVKLICSHGKETRASDRAWRSRGW